MAKKKRGNPNPTLPPSRGIPASESMWVPRHYGGNIREKGGLDESIIWGIEDVVDFIFPRKYQPTYFRVASDFLRLLLEKEALDKEDISRFLSEGGYSRATLENKIIPKLVSFGLVKRERKIEGRMKKGRSLILRDSLTFTNYMKRIGNAWKSLVSTARVKRKMSDK